MATTKSATKAAPKNNPLLKNETYVCGIAISQMGENECLKQIELFQRKIKSLQDLGDLGSSKVAGNIANYEGAIKLLVTRLDKTGAAAE